jgi:hypothetical protein
MISGDLVCAGDAVKIRGSSCAEALWPSGSPAERVFLLADRPLFATFVCSLV